MSRRSKGPRLWFREDRNAWFILDGARQRGTGCGPGDRAGAERALSAYLTTKHTTAALAGSRDPSQILIDDVLALYVRDKAGKLARPASAVAYTRALRPFWCGRPLSDVTGPNCRAYAAGRTTESMARHELEFLRAAINHHRKEGLHDRIVSVVLPDKPPPRERWLTKQEAAALIRAAWRYREVQNARATDRYTRRHVARFMVVARYMGSRAAVICGASIEDKRPPGRPWVDLARGVFHGRPAGQRVTKKRRQTMDVPMPLLAHMRRWRANGQRYVVQWNGRPVTSIAKAHRATVVAVGLGEWQGTGKDRRFVTDVTPHVWRHSVATWMAQGGVNPRQAAEFLGMSLQTYLNVYVGAGGSDFSEVHRVL